jgi:hypothetical protein
MVCVDVENKTVAEIANNVYQILTFMGVSMNNGKYIYSNPNSLNQSIQINNTIKSSNGNIAIDITSTDEINSFIAPHSFASFTPRPTTITTSSAQELLNQHHIQHHHNQHKSVASRLIDISKAANNRRKHGVKSQHHFQNYNSHNNNYKNTNQQMIEIPQYRVLTKTKTSTSTHTEMETETASFSYEKAFSSDEDGSNDLESK